MKVIDDDLWLCDDCRTYAANSDTSGIDDSKREREVIYGVDSLGPHLVANYDSETGEGLREFSHRTCDACRSNLSGSRTRFALLEPEPKVKPAPSAVRCKAMMYPAGDPENGPAERCALKAGHSGDHHFAWQE
jgi:hypothetical protein